MKTEIQTSLDKLRQLNAQVVEFVEKASPEQWRTLRTGEGWPVCVTARHIALGYNYSKSWLENLLNGQPITSTPQEFNEVNAAEASRKAEISKEEVQAFLLDNLAAFEKLVESLNSEQQSMTTLWVFMDRQVDPLFLVNGLIRHTTGHLESLKQALATANEPTRG